MAASRFTTLFSSSSQRMSRPVAGYLESLYLFCFLFLFVRRSFLAFFFQKKKRDVCVSWLHTQVNLFSCLLVTVSGRGLSCATSTSPRPPSLCETPLTNSPLPLAHHSRSEVPRGGGRRQQAGKKLGRRNKSQLRLANTPKLLIGLSSHETL